MGEKMANITRIKASGRGDKDEDTNDKSEAIVRASLKSKPDKEKAKKGKKAAKDDKKLAKKDKKANKTPIKLPLPLKIFLFPFILITKPFRAFGRYTRDSWKEIRQVRWPNRKLTWKLTAAMLIYTAIFMAFIMLLDMLFTFVFNKMLG